MIMMLATPIGADEQRDGAEAEEEAVEGALARRRAAVSAAEGWLTSTSFGLSGLAVAASTMRRRRSGS